MFWLPAFVICIEERQTLFFINLRTRKQYANIPNHNCRFIQTFLGRVCDEAASFSLLQRDHFARSYFFTSSGEHLLGCGLCSLHFTLRFVSYICRTLRQVPVSLDKLFFIVFMGCIILLCRIVISTCTLLTRNPSCLLKHAILVKVA